MANAATHGYTKVRTIHRLLAAAILRLLVITIAYVPVSAFAAIQLSTIATGLSNPLFVGHAGDGSNRLFIAQQGGAIRVLQPGASASTVFLDIGSKVASGGERGLLGLAFHPQYPRNGRFFVYYTRIEDGAITIAEYHVSADPNIADTSGTVLLTIPHAESVSHN